MARHQRPARRSKHVRVNGKPQRVGLGQVRGQLVATSVLTEAIVRHERALGRRMRVKYGELPLGWTTERAEHYAISRTSYEKMLYGENWAHLPFGMVRPTKRSGWRAWTNETRRGRIA